MPCKSLELGFAKPPLIPNVKYIEASCSLCTAYCVRPQQTANATPQRAAMQPNLQQKLKMKSWRFMVAQNFALNLTSLGLERKTSDNETPKWTSPLKKNMSFYHPVNRGTPLLILSQPLQHEPRKCYKVSAESKSSRWIHEVWGKPVDPVYLKPHANSSKPAKLGVRLLYNQIPYLNVPCWSQWLEMSQMTLLQANKLSFGS